MGENKEFLRSLAGIRIAALVTNSCAPDPRVIKQAESATKAGAQVTIFCMEGENLPNQETINGVYYKRLPSFNSAYNVALFKAARFTFCSLKENFFCGILLSLALLCLLFLKVISSVFQTVKSSLLQIAPKYWHSKESTKKEAFLFGKKFVRKIIYALYVFLRGDIFKFVFSPSVIAFKPDLIHAHDFITVPAALYCAEQTGAKVIFDAHEIEADRVGYNSPISISTVERDLKRYLPEIDGLIAVNRSALDFYMYNYNLYYTPKEIIYNSPIVKAPNTDMAAAIDLRDALSINSHETLFVYTGGIGIGRGVPEITEAMQSVPNTHLCIMGPQREAILEPYMDLVRSLNMEERVHFLPPVPHHAVTETIKSADIGIMFTLPTCLNHLYCLPNKLFESAMAGLPIVGPDLPEIERFVKEEKIGIIAKAGDTVALSEAIAKMAGNPLKYRPSPERLNELQEKWSWPAQEKKLIPFYQRVLKKPEADV